MASVHSKRVASGAALLWILSAYTPLHAQMGLGTWLKLSQTSAPGALTMSVEACCGSNGRRLIYRIVGAADVLMTVESPFDGRDVPVLVGGKPSGETMGIKLVDDHHSVTVIKMNGMTVGTSKATLSPDGKTLTVENTMTSNAGGQTIGTQTEIWVKK